MNKKYSYIAVDGSRQNVKSKSVSKISASPFRMSSEWSNLKEGVKSEKSKNETNFKSFQGKSEKNNEKNNFPSKNADSKSMKNINSEINENKIEYKDDFKNDQFINDNFDMNKIENESEKKLGNKNSGAPPKPIKNILDQYENNVGFNKTDVENEMKERIKNINSDENTDSKNTDSKNTDFENTDIDESKSVDTPNNIPSNMDTNISSKRGLSWIGMGGPKKNPDTNTGPNTPDNSEKGWLGFNKKAPLKIDTGEGLALDENLKGPDRSYSPMIGSSLSAGLGRLSPWGSGVKN